MIWRARAGLMQNVDVGVLGCLVMLAVVWQAWSQWMVRTVLQDQWEGCFSAVEPFRKGHA